jgi:hypothetical protein
MIALLRFLLTLLVSPFRSKSRLEAENAALRHQLIALAAEDARPRPPHESEFSVHTIPILSELHHQDLSRPAIALRVPRPMWPVQASL